MTPKMIKDITTRYAELLVHYCLQVKPGDKVFIATTLLAEPLLREVYRVAYAAGAALVEYDLAFQERERVLMQNASDDALLTPPLLHGIAMESFDCYLNIRAPYNLRDNSGATAERAQKRTEALAPTQVATATGKPVIVSFTLHHDARCAAVSVSRTPLPP